MLASFRVSNFLLIDDLTLDLKPGLTTITGETGAGKSIVLGALKLVLGERADLSQIKNQENKCVIEAVFSKIDIPEVTQLLKAEDIDIWPELILRREISPTGNSRAFANDTPVRLEVLKGLSPYLIDIHSQFNTADIVQDQYQLQVLDAVAGISKQRIEFSKEYHDWRSGLKALEEKKEALEAKDKESDYQQFLLSELEALKLEDVREQENLENELKILENAHEILAQLQKADQILTHEEIGVFENLRRLISEIGSIASFDPELEALSERLQSVKIELNDIGEELLQVQNRTEADPEKLNLYQNRLSEIYRLQQKHQVQSIEALLELQEALQKSGANSLALEQEIKKLEQKLALQQKDLDDRALEMHSKRRAHAEKVCENLKSSLTLLGMPHSQIVLDIEETETLNAQGKSKVQMRFSSNPGIPLSSLEKGISGGERSRLMFAVKKMLAAHQNLPTLVFDEIDTGISGRIADEMGKLMSEMALHTQMITITHLAQIAAKGQNHYKVIKTTDGDRTQTDIQPLDLMEREKEIAGMISGSEISQAALAQAKSLLKS